MSNFAARTHGLITSWFKSWQGKDRPHRGRSRYRTVDGQYCRLESRQLLAGIVFNADIGQVLIGGTTGVDSALVTQLGNQITVDVAGVESATFNATNIQEIVFVGLAGDDRFENRSSIVSRAFGQAGNDTLIGGSANDVLVGNNGNDTIIGNAGDDRIIAGIDNDQVEAGAGDDLVLGVGGSNRIDGGLGDDLIFGGNQVDTITDPAGQNTIAAGGGDDRVGGGSGVDLIFAGPGDDLVFGNGADDEIYGQAGNDSLVGNAGADLLSGNDGNDLLTGQFGDDLLVGGAGFDQSNHSGLTSEYRAEEIDTSFSLADLRSAQFGGTDLLVGIEQANFADGASAPEDLVDNDDADDIERVFVQPIVASNNDGSNRAEFFGNAAQQADILERIDQIFSQAGIDVEFLPARQVNNTTVNVGSGGGTRTRADLSRIVRFGDEQGLGSADSRVIDLYFVERVPGFADTSNFTANGLAFVGASGIAFHSGDSLVANASGRQVLARVAAHEIGHNLGLSHVEDDGNLLSDGRGTGLTQAQINTILASRISQPV